MLEILTRITEGRGKLEDLDTIADIAEGMEIGSLCALGQLTPGPIKSALRYFRDEFEAHILDKRCPAGVCTKLIRYVVVAEKCTGCQACKKACPTEAIRGTLKDVHMIDQTKCIKCGACQEACRFEAIEAQREEAIQVV